METIIVILIAVLVWDIWDRVKNRIGGGVLRVLSAPRRWQSERDKTLPLVASLTIDGEHYVIWALGTLKSDMFVVTMGRRLSSGTMDVHGVIGIYSGVSNAREALLKHLNEHIKGHKLFFGDIIWEEHYDLKP